MFSFGSAEKGQLGNGTTGERIATGNKTSFDIEADPGNFNFFLDVLKLTVDLFLVYIRELDGKNIVQISSGQQHSLAIDETGYTSSNPRETHRLKTALP